MNPEAITRVLREGLVMILELSAGPMLASMIIGLVVAIFQATTQIQEQTLSYVPKLTGVFVTIAIIGAIPLSRHPQVLVALNPYRGIALLAHRPLVALAVIGAARHTLAVENEEMGDSVITSALEAAAKRGVNVTITMTAESDWDSAFSALVSSLGIIHMVLPGPWAICGSVCRY